VTWTLAAGEAVNGTLVTSVVTGVLGLGSGGTVVALLRVNADRGKVVVEAAQGAVIVQTGVITALQDELRRVTGEMAAQQVRWDTEMADLRAEHAAERSRWQEENTQLRRRIAAVEQAADGDLGPAVP
jgi:hypothetical protein